MALYHALGSEAGCRLTMEVLDLKDWPFYQNYCALADGEQPGTPEDLPGAGASPPTAASAT